MESQPQNPELGNNPENFHLCLHEGREDRNMTTNTHKVVSIECMFKIFTLCIWDKYQNLMNWLNQLGSIKATFYSPTSIEQPYQDRIKELQILVKLIT